MNNEIDYLSQKYDIVTYKSNKKLKTYVLINYNVEYVDSITEAGPCKIITGDSFFSYREKKLSNKLVALGRKKVIYWNENFL